MKSGTKNIVRIVISILYIIWGVAAPLTALDAIIAFNISALIGAVGGILMLLGGIFALFKMKTNLCRTFGIIIFLVNAVAFVLSIFSGISWSPLVSALLAWLFIICL